MLCPAQAAISMSRSSHRIVQRWRGRIAPRTTSGSLAGAQRSASILLASRPISMLFPSPLAAIRSARLRPSRPPMLFPSPLADIRSARLRPSRPPTVGTAKVCTPVRAAAQSRPPTVGTAKVCTPVRAAAQRTAVRTTILIDDDKQFRWPFEVQVQEISEFQFTVGHSHNHHHHRN